jgi:hypothetical protein
LGLFLRFESPFGDKCFLTISAVNACFPLSLFLKLFVETFEIFDDTNSESALFAKVLTLVFGVLVDGILRLTRQAVEAAETIVGWAYLAVD